MNLYNSYGLLYLGHLVNKHYSDNTYYLVETPETSRKSIQVFSANVDPLRFLGGLELFPSLICFCFFNNGL